MRWQRGSPNQAYGAWIYPSSWQGTTATAKTMTGMTTGWTYCFSVRVRDKAGNISAWSQPLCTGKMFDDRSLQATGSWTRPSGKAGFYGKTYSRRRLLRHGPLTAAATVGVARR